MDEAVVRFSLHYLEKLELISFRGDIDQNLKNLLEQHNFYRDTNRQFQLILRGSGMIYRKYFVSLNVGETKMATTYQKLSNEEDQDEPQSKVALYPTPPLNMIIGRFFFNLPH